MTAPDHDASFQPRARRASSPEQPEGYDIGTAAENAASKTPKGQATRQRILQAVDDMLSDTGLDGITMRGVAERLGMRLNNVQYYFASRDALVQGFVENVVGHYHHGYQALLHDPAMSWAEKAEAFARFSLGDVRSLPTRRIFLSILAHAQRDEFAMARLHELYAYQQRMIGQLICGVNGKRPSKAVEIRAALIMAQIDGLMTLAGAHGQFRDMPAGFEEECLRVILAGFTLG